MKNFVVYMLLISVSYSCKDESTLPKPKAFLALEYSKANYYKTDLDCPFSFKVNTVSKLKNNIQNKPCWLNIEYPAMKGSIYISYYPIQDNLKSLIFDAQKLPLSHEIKADVISSQTFINEQNNSSGLFYQIEGNAASQAQFYLTDSLKHFITGSIYFKAVPNYDSILPAAKYLKNDMRKIIESMTWKD